MSRTDLQSGAVAPAVPTNPPRSPGRIAALDVARGIAILGTLATNIWIFSHPGGFLGYLAEPVSPADGWAPVFERMFMALANGKFLGLLTLMFGIGLAIQRNSAVRRGRSWPGSYPWRALLLFLDGVLHYFLVVEFDVLMGYAVTGLVVAWIIAGTPRTQRRWIIATSVVHVLVITALTVLLVTAGAGLGDPVSVGENLYATGSWWDLVVQRWELLAVFRMEPILIFGMGIALFTLGAQLLERGLFEQRGAGLRSVLIRIGAVALLVDLVLAMTLPDLMLVNRYVLAPLVSLGLLSLIAAGWLYRTPGFVGRRLTDVGRMALTCYIVQNILASVLFQGWGFGLAQVPADDRTWLTVAAFVGLCAVMVTASHLWLRRFERGPVEWLWARGYALLARS
ncbi:DUF418 domain-containing protein [Microlunatus sp. Y2014]|uniref:DUF418 domain-containing protein n=1 Tax=Microlunatus sp. Y2014 TaxID=3418488 RepID=UPI003DA6EF3A